MIKSVVARVAVVLLVAAIVVAGRDFFFYVAGQDFLFYRGFYHPQPTEMPSYQQIAVPLAPVAQSPFVDNFTDGKGIVLVDMAHENAFAKEELNTLFLRLVSRGLTVKFLSPKDDLKEELLAEVEKKSDKSSSKGTAGDNQTTEEKLEPPDAFAVIAPQLDFSKDDLKTVEKFVSRGGRLLLIADPTRKGPRINNLATKFGLMFESDYLYNMKEHEINYRNIFVTDFKPGAVTKKLGKIALYTAGSISSADSGVAFTGNGTFSSLIESRQRLSPIILSSDGKILGIYDFTFMTEPYNSVLDNNQLVANIADWLVPASKVASSK